MGYEWVYSIYRRKADLVEGYSNGEIGVKEFFPNPFFILLAKDKYRLIKDRIKFLNKLHIEAIPLEKRLLGLEH